MWTPMGGMIWVEQWWEWLNWWSRLHFRWYSHVVKINKDKLVKRVYEGRIGGGSINGRWQVKQINRMDEYWRESVWVGMQGVKMCWSVPEEDELDNVSAVFTPLYEEPVSGETIVHIDRWTIYITIGSHLPVYILTPAPDWELLTKGWPWHMCQRLTLGMCHKMELWMTDENGQVLSIAPPQQ